MLLFLFLGGIKVYLHELTLEQKSFAEEHHGLVHAFLRAKKLRQDEYYDVIVFAYLQSVQKYLLRADLQEKYAFTTIAWRAMSRDLSRHQHQQSRRPMAVSIDETMYGSERLTRAEQIPGYDQTREWLDAITFLEDIADCLTGEQMDILHLRADGYSIREIAVRQKRRLREIEDIRRNFRMTVSR